MGRNKKKGQKGSCSSLQVENQLKDELLKINLSTTTKPIIKAFTTDKEEIKRNTFPCDVIVRTNGQEFSAHKKILAQKSLFFKEKLERNPEKSTFLITSISDSNMKWILNFLYSEFLTVTEYDVFGLLEAALILKVKRASDHCFRYLTKHNILYSCVPTYDLAKKYKQTCWMAVTQLYIIKNFDSASNEKKFYDFDYEDFIAILQAKELYVTTETIVYLAVIKWLQHKPIERKHHLDYLLKLIRFPQINFYLLCHKVQNNKLIMSTATAKYLINEAILYHQSKKETIISVST